MTRDEIIAIGFMASWIDGFIERCAKKQHVDSGEALELLENLHYNLKRIKKMAVLNLKRKEESCE